MNPNHSPDWQHYDAPEGPPRDRHPSAGDERHSAREAWFDVPDWKRGAQRASELRREYGPREPWQHDPRIDSMRGESSRWDEGRYSSRERTERADTRAFRGVGPRGYTRPDGQIADDVYCRLTDAPDIDAGSLEHSVRGGEVVLTGTVRDRRTKRMVEALVERVAGVTHVQNNLRVKPPLDDGNGRTNATRSGGEQPPS
jgi:hypothetical protein